MQDEVFDEKPFNDYVMDLHNYITDLKNMQVRIGLHIWDNRHSRTGNYLMLLTRRLENGDIPSFDAGIGKNSIWFDYYDLLENSSLIYNC